MNRAALFSLSSRWEGLANVLVEAMACETPVVSTDSPNGPREILEYARHGALVAPADPMALAHAIEAQLDTPASSTAIQRAQAFGADTAVSRYMTVLGL